MDVRALFPSVTSKLGCQSIMEALELIDIDFQDIDIELLTRYVALTHDQPTIRRYKLDGKLPVPKSTTTLGSFLKHRSHAQFSTNPDCSRLTKNEVKIHLDKQTYRNTDIQTHRQIY